MDFVKFVAFGLGGGCCPGQKLFHFLFMVQASGLPRENQKSHIRFHNILTYMSDENKNHSS